MSHIGEGIKLEEIYKQEYEILVKNIDFEYVHIKCNGYKVQSLQCVRTQICSFFSFVDLCNKPNT